MKHVLSTRGINLYAALILCLLLGIPFPGLFAQEPLTLQVYPYEPSTKIMQDFTPLADYLKEALTQNITIRISKDHKEHVSEIGNDRVDIAYLGPATYVEVVEKFGKKPIIARVEMNGSPMLQGVIFTSALSPVTSLKDLKGKSFAFGYRNSTMSHIIPLYMLQKDGVYAEDLSHHAFLSDQYNVVLGVLMGDFDAGAVNAGIFSRYRDRGLRALAWTPKVSEHLFVARSSLPEKGLAELRNAFFNVSNNRNGPSIMSSIRKGITAFVPGSDSDYDDLRNVFQQIKKSSIQ